LSENTDESWKAKTERKLAADRGEVRKLEMEFKDIPKLYRKFIKDSESDSEREGFVEQLNDAYYRRDHIENLMEQPKGKSISDSALAIKEADKNLRPNQKAKIKCREIAEELWEKHYIRSKEMANRPELIEVAGVYTLEVRRRWICDLAPPELRKGGAPKKKQSKPST
jgi:hypothetical protein